MTVTAEPGQITARDPATGEVLASYPIADETAVRQVVAAAKLAQPAWAATPLRERLRLVRNFQKLIFERKREIATAITRESGKPLGEAIAAEVIVVLDTCRFLVENAWPLLRDEGVAHGSLAMKTKSGVIRHEPYGVVGIIAPWNFPFSIPAQQALTALVCGNVVVIKPSEFTTGASVLLRDLLVEAGFPAEVVHVIAGEGPTGAALIASNIQKLVFTGSVATGKRVAEAAAKRLLPIVLELGGKDAMVVLEDCDVEVAASAAVWGAMVNAGQACLSVERCFVHRSLYAKFVELAAEKTKALHVGNGLEEGTDVGPMIHERQLAIVESHVNGALARGAHLVTGGHRVPSLGPNFYMPTLLADVSLDMRVMREETFGPVLPVMAFDSDDEAVRLANDSEFGLSASVWTKNKKRGRALAQRIEAGVVMVNDAVACFGISEAPHGGVKASGIGRTHGRFGIEEMTWPKYISSEALRWKPWWYPYAPGFAQQMEGFADLMFGGFWRRLSGLWRSKGALRK